MPLMIDEPTSCIAAQGIMTISDRQHAASR